MAEVTFCRSDGPTRWPSDSVPGPKSTHSAGLGTGVGSSIAGGKEGRSLQQLHESAGGKR